MDVRLFHRRLFDAVSAIVPPDASIVCAVSGGADSVALLHGLGEINRRRRQGWTLHVAHFDHSLRDRSPEDASFVRDLAESLGLCWTVERADVRNAAVAGKLTLEQAARRMRYDFLERLARRLGACCVLTGHHADDQAETVLHHILRGAGLTGLSGIPAARPITPGSAIQLVRPLLGFTRDELLAYLTARALSWREDETNTNVEYTRNRIRHELLPLLRDRFNPRVVDALTRLAGHARSADAVMADAGRALLECAKARADSSAVETSHPVESVIAIDVQMLASAPRAVAAEAIKLACESLGPPLQALDFERLTAATGLIEGGGRRRTIELPGGLRVQRRGRCLIIGSPEDLATHRPASRRRQPRRRSL